MVRLHADLVRDRRHQGDMRDESEMVGMEADDGGVIHEVGVCQGGHGRAAEVTRRVVRVGRRLGGLVVLVLVLVVLAVEEVEEQEEEGEE
jgi:hypothetical protein